MSNAIVLIEFSCGHEDERDLSAKSAGERAGYAAWLAKSPCTDCWKKKQKRTLSKEVREERAAAHDEAVADQERSRLPVLHGSQKQCDWALRARYELLRDAYTSLVEDGSLDEERFETEVLEPARRITAARWWIDNREEAGQILALLADPGNSQWQICTRNLRGSRRSLTASPL